MEGDIFEFQAPQYIDFYCCSIVNDMSYEEDNSYFGSLKENIAPDCSENSQRDKRNYVNISDFSVFAKTGSSNFLGLKTGERTYSDKRSSVLCEKQEDSSSFVMKLTDALDNIIINNNQSNKTPDHKSIIKQKPFKQEAYLFTTKSKLKTPKKGKAALKQLVESATGDKLDPAEENSYGGIGITNTHNRITVVRPFSFQARDEEMLKKKQEKLLKAQEEDKISREFQARPVPSYILSSNQNKMNIKTPVQNKPKKIITKVQSGEEKTFKAKFPEVLYKEPFVPVRHEKPPTTPPKNILLHTERRANERKTFSK